MGLTLITSLIISFLKLSYWLVLPLLIDRAVVKVDPIPDVPSWAVESEYITFCQNLIKEIFIYP